MITKLTFTGVLASMTLAACGGGGEGASSAQVITPSHPTGQGGTVPDYVLTPGSGPLVVLMATTKETATLGVMGTVPSRLISAGYKLLALDLPCHGADEDPNLPPLNQLTCWRNRIESGDSQIFTRFCDGLSDVFDELDVEQVYVVGQSRGGYVAAVCAARDARIRKVVMIAPVTDLQRLSEFAGATVDQATFGLARFFETLKTIEVRVRIGNNDTRVDTASAVAFAQAINADLDLVDIPGHVPPEDGSTVRWLAD
jgi:pimeloyl-ACP methyl ester carboxylesterase